MDEIPAEYATTLRIQHVGIDKTVQTSELDSARLTVTYAGADHHPELRLNGDLLSSGSATTQGTVNDLILTVDHPYADESGTFCDQTSTYKFKSGAAYAIVYGFGGTSESLITKCQQRLDGYRAAGLAEDSEPVRGETLNIMGLMWIKQAQLTENILSEISNVITIPHHCIGRMSQEDSYYVDVATWTANSVPKDTGDTMPAFYGSGLISSALEHSVLEVNDGTKCARRVDGQDPPDCKCRESEAVPGNELQHRLDCGPTQQLRCCQPQIKTCKRKRGRTDPASKRSC